MAPPAARRMPPTAARREPAREATKGERTRAAILDEALRLVSKAGLDDLTIGTLAEATGLSKSGLFAHFGSREDLLLAVLEHGQRQFTDVVLKPALAKTRGVPRLRSMVTNWLDWTESAELPGGCPMIGGAAEFDDKPGPVRDMLAAGQRTWIETLKRAVRQALEERQLGRETDPEQMAFEMFGIALVVHHHRRLLGYKKARERALSALDAVLDRHSNPRKSLRAVR